jgi:hypothetical protein
MPVDPGADLIVEKARALWWVLTNPVMVALYVFSLWHAGYRRRFFDRKDLEEWREVNRRNR